MKITIIGTGYVGLVAAACLAEVGNNVLCLDLDTAKIKKLQDGTVPFYEPGLQDLVQKNYSSGRLLFTSSIQESVDFAELQFIAVGTPSDEDGSADLIHVIAAARNIGKFMSSSKVIVIKSTVPVGTADKVLTSVNNELDIRKIIMNVSVVSNPEFLKEGVAVKDFMRPDRILIGVENSYSEHLLRAIYSPFNRNHDRVIVMNIKSAELTKYAANCMLATRISFMNELANLADSLGVDIEQVRMGIGSDSRIGYDFLYPGCGFGGSCFPKDINALIRTSEEFGQHLKILNSVKEVNDSQKKILLKKIEAKFGPDLDGKHFAIWGLAFKPNTDDMREATSISIMQGLWDRNATITAYDPMAMEVSKRIFADNTRITYSDTPLNCLNNANALIIITEWKEFIAQDLHKIKLMLKEPIIFDGRNIFHPEEARAIGLYYSTVGRGD
jgi:UDPglucose 6-dehydrogenase